MSSLFELILSLMVLQPAFCSFWHSCTEMETEGADQGGLCHHCPPTPPLTPGLLSPFQISLFKTSSSWDSSESVRDGEVEQEEL